VDCSFIFERFQRIGFFDRHVRPHLWLALRHVGLEAFLSLGSSYGDQGFAEMVLAEAGVPIIHLGRELPGMFSTFNYTATAAVEPKGSVCLMMGRPKPHQVGAGWISRHWRVLSETDNDPVET
jgi:hypothetical protein